jgi:hypothetical protein
MRAAFLACLMGTVFTLSMADHAAAQRLRPEDVGEIRGLKLGMAAADMEENDFGEFYCGANGGAPRQRIADWTENTKCRTEPTGLREVLVRFADHIELYARANEQENLLKRFSGTRVAGQQVLLSVLFDDAGISRGIRMITDPRAPVGERRAGHMFRFSIFQRYGEAEWKCVDLPAAEGETPVAGVWVKVDCEKQMPDKHLLIQSRFFRKAGQRDMDVVNNEPTIGQFESSTRFEILDPSAKRG